MLGTILDASDTSVNKTDFLKARLLLTGRISPVPLDLQSEWAFSPPLTLPETVNLLVYYAQQFLFSYFTWLLRQHLSLKLSLRFLRYHTFQHSFLTLTVAFQSSLQASLPLPIFQISVFLAQACFFVGDILFALVSWLTGHFKSFYLHLKSFSRAPSYYCQTAHRHL